MEKLPVELKRKEDIVKEYRLDQFVYNSTITGNIAFTLQYVIFNLDLMENYASQKSLKAVTCKQLLINIFSVLEGMMFGAAETLQGMCDNVKECKTPCELYFNHHDTSKFIKFDTIKEHLKKIGALVFSENGNEFIGMAKDLRNNIHLCRSSEIDSENTNYSVKNIAKSLNTVKEVANVLVDFIKRCEQSKQCLSGKYAESAI